MTVVVIDEFTVLVRMWRGWHVGVEGWVENVLRLLIRRAAPSSVVAPDGCRRRIEDWVVSNQSIQRKNGLLPGFSRISRRAGPSSEPIPLFLSVLDVV